MKNPHETQDDRYYDALSLIHSIVQAYNNVTKRDGGGRMHMGAIGRTGCHIFWRLAENRGAFVRPVPYDRTKLAEDTAMSIGTADKAMKRLSEQGLVKVSRTGSVATVQLHVPPHVFAMYRQWENSFPSHERAGPPPIEQHQLEAIMALLDKPGFEGYAKRQETWW